MPKNRKNKRAGFSLMEVMLSVAVLSIGIMGVLPLIVSGLREALDSRDQVIASMLAQEGAELAQNIRDNNWASGDDAFKTLSFPNVSRKDCRVDYNNTDVGGMKCINVSKALYLNADNFYTHSVVTATKFQRKIEVEYSNNDGNPNTAANADQAIITSMVIWSGSSGVFPALVASCNTANKCAYDKVVLTTWY